MFIDNTSDKTKMTAESLKSFISLPSHSSQCSNNRYTNGFKIRIILFAVSIVLFCCAVLGVEVNFLFTFADRYAYNISSASLAFRRLWAMKNKRPLDVRRRPSPGQLEIAYGNYSRK